MIDTAGEDGRRFWGSSKVGFGRSWVSVALAESRPLVGRGPSRSREKDKQPDVWRQTVATALTLLGGCTEKALARALATAQGAWNSVSVAVSSLRRFSQRGTVCTAVFHSHEVGAPIHSLPISWKGLGTLPSPRDVAS